MPLTGEAQVIVDRIDENCKLLYSGYTEHVDYNLEVAYHRNSCSHYGKSTIPKEDCECPVVNEKRVRQIKRKGYLDQLREFAQNKDTDRELKAERGAPRIKVAGRPPGDLGGFFTLDEIECEIPYIVDRVLEEVGRDRTWACQSARHILIGLANQCCHFADARPDQLRVIDKACSKWVATARSTLRISTRDTIFDSIVCGNCGGGLSTPAGNRGESDVRCVGTPEQPPCGETYPPGEWLTLYERSQARQS
jgi:hypothetical protein